MDDVSEASRKLAVTGSETKGTIRRGEVRRDQIVSIAQRIFLENGYGQTTMNAIARAACASKETLYRHFGSKEDLFATIMRMKSKQIATGLDEDLDLAATPDDVLRAIGLKLLRKLSSPDALSFLGWVIAETPRAPEIGRIFYELGPAMIAAKLNDYFTEAANRNLLCCGDPALATKLFLGTIMTDFQVRLLSPGSNDMSEAEIQELVATAVSMFLARYRSDQSLRAGSSSPR